MKDQIEIYNMNDEMITIDTVKGFYNRVEKDFEDEGIASKKVKTISLILMNSNGDIYVQKRTKDKIRTSGRYDKTIGGHVAVGDDFERSLIIECGQNLGMSAVVEPVHNFIDRARSLDLKRMSVCREVEYISNFMAKKILNNGEKYSYPYMNMIYIGYFDGELDFVNGKDAKIELHSLTKLQKILENDPYEVTHDLKFIMNNYAELLVPLKN